MHRIEPDRGIAADLVRSALLATLANRWTVLALVALAERPRRFVEIVRLVKGISHRSLSAVLKRLIQAGLVTREVFTVSPPMVVYSLTDRGLELGALQSPVLEWIHGQSQRTDGKSEISASA